MTRHLDPDTLLQVTDTDGRTHAASIGPGVLCQATIPDRAAPAVQTVAWDWGTDLVTCRDCKRRVYELQVATA